MRPKDHTETAKRLKAVYDKDKAWIDSLLEKRFTSEEKTDLLRKKRLSMTEYENHNLPKFLWRRGGSDLGTILYFTEDIPTVSHSIIGLHNPDVDPGYSLRWASLERQLDGIDRHTDKKMWLELEERMGRYEHTDGSPRAHGGSSL